MKDAGAALILLQIYSTLYEKGSCMSNTRVGRIQRERTAEDFFLKLAVQLN